MKHRTLSRALLSATVLAAAAGATPASAQRIERIVAFGDSYADDGNVFQLTGLNPLTFQGGIYPTGRFSGGSNYIDTLSILLNAPVENFAIGGASAVRGSGSPFDLQFEVDQFLNVGTQSPAFPAGSTSFGPNDLVAVSIGGNDARYFQQGLANGRTVNDSIAAATTQLNRLVAAGAPTISFLAGNTALLPEVATNPAAQAIRNTFSTTYNMALQNVLAGYAANGTMVHYLDLSAVLNSIQANPTAFGITNGVACAPTQANVISGCAGYVFYVDQLHLSSDGFRIVGQYVAAQLRAPLTFAGPTDLGVDTARQFGQTLSSRVDLGSPRDGEVAQGLKFFITGDTFSRDVNDSDQTRAFDMDGVGGTVGAELGFGNGVLGVAGNYTRGTAKFGGDIADDRMRSVQVGGYAGYAIGPLFVQGHVGYGWDRHRLTRSGVIDQLEARADGNHWSAGAKAGYLTPVGIFRVGPVAAIDYAKAEIDGYTEQGDAALRLNVDDQSYNSTTGGIGVEARGDFAGGGIALRPFASAMLEKELSDDDRTVRFSQTSSPVIVNSWELGSRDRSLYGRLTGGASAAILANASLDARVSSTVGKDDGNDLSAQVGLKVGF